MARKLFGRKALRRCLSEKYVLLGLWRGAKKTTKSCPQVIHNTPSVRGPNVICGIPDVKKKISQKEKKQKKITFCSCKSHIEAKKT